MTFSKRYTRVAIGDLGILLIYTYSVYVFALHLVYANKGSRASSSAVPTSCAFEVRTNIKTVTASTKSAPVTKYGKPSQTAPFCFNPIVYSHALRGPLIEPPMARSIVIAE